MWIVSTVFVRVRVAVCEEVLVVDEVIDYAVRGDVFHDADIELPAVRTEIHLEGALVDHLLLPLLLDAGITRKDDLYVAVLFHESFWKCIHDIAETTGLDEGIALGSDEGDGAPRLGEWLGFRLRCCLRLSRLLCGNFLCRGRCRLSSRCLSGCPGLLFDLGGLLGSCLLELCRLCFLLRLLCLLCFGDSFRCKPFCLRRIGRS